MPSLALGGLPRRYSALFALGLAPVLLIVGLLVLWQFHEQRSAMLGSLARTATEQRLALGAALTPARNYVQRLRRVAEVLLAEGAAAPPSPLRAGLRQAATDAATGVVGGIYLDDIAGSPRAGRSGNLIGRPGLLDAARPDPHEIDMALALMEQMWLGHADTPYLRWSYYFSARADLTSFYPFTPSTEMIAGHGFTDLDAWFASWADFDILRRAEPDVNPQRLAFWTPPYVDGYGAGWMVSRAAPVYDGDRFAGIVGTDVTLSFLADFLQGSTLSVGQAWLVSDKGEVVAGSGVPAEDVSQAPDLASVLPASLAAVPLGDLLRDTPVFQRMDQHWLMAQPIDGSPWHMLWIVPAASLDASLLPRFLPSALILAGVALALVLAQWLLQRLFVRPALALVDHVHAESRNRPRPLPHLPGLWQTLADRVTDAFAARRELAVVSSRFETAAESLRDGLAIWDADDRLVYHNSRYPGHLAESLRSVLQPGIRFDDWLRKGLGIGPIYHPDMGEDFVDRRLAMRRQDGSDHEHRLADGRWVRLRESPMPDGGRVLLTSDITARRAQAEALADQTRKLEAVLANIAEGVTLVDAQGRVLLVNDGFMWLYGFPAELAKPGTPLADFVRDRLRRGDLRAGDEPVGTEEDLEGAVQRRVQHLLATPSRSYEEPRPGGRIVHVQRRRLPDGLLVSTYTDVTEQRQHERELAMLATAIDQVGDSVEISTPDYKLVYVNPAFTRLTGYAAHEAIGKTPQQLLRSDRHDEAFFAEIDRTTRSGATWTGRLISRHKHGHELIQHATISPLHDEAGRLIHFIAVKRDVSDRERALEALRDSEERYRGVVEAQTEFIVRQRPDGAITFTNDAFCRHRGMTRQAMLAGYNDLERLPAAARDAVLRHWCSLSPEQPIVTYDLRLDQPDSSARYEQWTDRAVFDSQGRLVEYQSIGRDITAERQAEAALRASEERFRTIVEDQVEFIARCNPDFVYTFLNQAYARQLGRSREELLGTSVLALMTPEQQEQFRAQLAQLTPDRPTTTYEMTGASPDGEPVTELWTDRALFDIDGRLVEYQSVGRDVTTQKRAEQALRQSEERFRSVVQDQTETIGRFDARFRRIFANDADCRLHGKTLDELLGQDFFDSVAPRVREHLRRRMLALTPDNPVDIGENERVLPDGSLRWYSWTNRALFDQDGRLTGYQSVGRDITEERNTALALRESEARLGGFLENAPVGMYLKSIDGRYVMANPEMAKVFGRPVQKMIGRTAAEALPADEAEMVRAYDREVIESGRPTIHEEYLEGLQAYGWSMVIRFPVRDAQGNITHIGGFDVDISTQKAAERTLKESEQRFRQFAEAHPVPLMVLRLADSRVLFVNPAYLSLLQLSAEGLDALDRHQLWANPAERAPYLDRLRRDGEIRGYDLMVRRQDGSVLPARMSSRLIEYGGEAALVTSVIDLSQQRAAESEIQRQREALHQSEKLAALGSLLAGVAHELNNPLSVVVGYSSMLEEFAPDDATRRRAERVHAAADRCARIVKAFLAMARQKPPKFGPVALNHVVEAALELAAYGLRTADIEVVRELDTDLPAVWGDSDQLHQVLTNLIVNAQHALQQIEGPRRLVLCSRHGHGEVEVLVEDNGPGMADDIRKRIFEPFFTTKPQGMGVGVGLSLCHGIVAGHGGRIEVETAPAQGSRFVITLPLSLRDVANGEPAQVEPRIAGRGRVLVVDDEAELADLVREVLSRDGYEVSLARSGREALALLAKQEVDVIVSDLRMPDLDGPGLWRELRAKRTELASRMIFVTGDTLGADASRFLREADVPVMEKPLDLAELRRRVNEVVERH